MARHELGRLIEEHPLGAEELKSNSGDSRMVRPARSVSVNAAESPLGWLFARGLITPIQFEAGERLRLDWELGQFQPRVTMSWDAAPVAKGRGGSAPGVDLTDSQMDAHRRFNDAIAAQARACPIFYGAWFASATACGRRKRRSAGRLVPASSS